MACVTIIIILTILLLQQISKTFQSDSDFVERRLNQNCEGRPINDHGDVQQFTKSHQILSIFNGADCAVICRNTQWCKFSRFNNDFNTCELFWDGKFIPNHAGYYVSRWVCNNVAANCDSGYPDRCSGYWTQYFSVNISAYEMLRVKTNNHNECQDFCAKYYSPCFATQFFNPSKVHNSDTNCILYSPNFKYKFPTKITAESWNKNNQTVVIIEPISITSIWTCCINQLSEYIINKRCSQFASQSCYGNWQQLDTKPNPPPIKYSPVSISLMLSSHSCLDECQHHTQCTFASYNQTYFLCLLFTNSIRETLLDLDEKNVASYLYTTWTWKCDDTCIQSQKPVLKDRCVCYSVNNFTENPITFYATKQCNRPLIKPTLHAVPEVTAFWLVDNSTSLSNVMHVSNSWLEGYIELDNLTNNNSIISMCDVENCKTYSSQFSRQESSKANLYPRFVSRNEWFAKPAKENLTSFAKTPIKVIIINYNRPALRSCATLLGCSFAIRMLQYHFMDDGPGFSDMPYNYVIGENDVVYEGRGHKYKGAHTYGQNDISIGIGIPGNFFVSKINGKIIKTIRKLIFYLVDHGYLSLNYSIHPHPKYTFKYLKYALKNLPNYKVHKVSVDDSVCLETLQLSKLSLIIPLAVVFISIPALVVLLTVWTWKIRLNHSGACKLTNSKILPSSIASPHTICLFLAQQNADLNLLVNNNTISRHSMAFVNNNSLEINTLHILSADKMEINTALTTVYFIEETKEPRSCGCKEWCKTIWRKCSVEKLEKFLNIVFSTLSIKQCRKCLLAMSCKTIKRSKSNNILFILHSSDATFITNVIKRLSLSYSKCNCKFFNNAIFTRLNLITLRKNCYMYDATAAVEDIEFWKEKRKNNEQEYEICKDNPPEIKHLLLGFENFMAQKNDKVISIHAMTVDLSKIENMNMSNVKGINLY